MRVPLGLVVAVMALVARALPLAAQGSPPPPIVKVEGLRQISPHVYIIPDNSVPLVPNVGYVIGDQAVLVIDTGLGPQNGAAVYEVRKNLPVRSSFISSRRTFILSTILAPRLFRLPQY
jgi:hypothetical protein